MSGKFLWVNNFTLIIFLISIFISCTNQTTKLNNETVPVANFENGDLIFRHGNGFFSDYFKNRSKHEQIYSHGGIISLEADSIYVIHSEASEFTGIGGVKKEPLSIFLTNISTWGVYRLDTIQAIRDSIVANTSKYIEAETAFDFDFDNSSDEKIYCTELIAITVNKAMNRPIIFATNTFRGKSYYSVDDTYLIPQIKLIMRIDN